MIVIGCGESGLLAGIRLKEAGIPFTIVEKNAGVGGTWWQNTYPGARVDVGNHFYCYSFEPTDQWNALLCRAARTAGLLPNRDGQVRRRQPCAVETEVTEASWDDDTATWSVRARDRNGATTTTLSARAVISAVGQLNRPHLPDIDGQQDFAGPALHSSEWDHSVDLRGKRVAMIGAGDSGFQIAPAIADDVDRVTVFQRTAQWIFPNPNYHAEVGPGYPNFFCMYGPGTNLAHGGSLIFHSECQMRYITECLELLVGGGHASLEPREDKATDWHEPSQAEMRRAGVVTALGQALVLVKNSFGEVHILSPWRLVDYWTWTREPDPADFIFR